MYDVFFLSYDEVDADDRWYTFNRRWPHAKRVHGIKGIANAHKRCAELSFTTMFWTIDADTDVDEDFDLRFAVPVWDRKYLHLWYSRNPVNGLEYGYGAVKLWPKRGVLTFDGKWLDFTTAVGNMKIMPRTVATTKFNTDPYSSWKSGFREAIKLCKASAAGDVESSKRLSVWLNVMHDVPYAVEAIVGARTGYSYYQRNSMDPTALDMINDFDKLKDHYASLGDLSSIDVSNEIKFDHV